MLNELDFDLPSDEDFVKKEDEENTLDFALAPSESTEDDYALDFNLPLDTSSPPPYKATPDGYEESSMAEDKAALLTSLSTDYGFILD